MGKSYTDEKFNNYSRWIDKTPGYDRYDDHTFFGWFRLEKGANVKEAVNEIIAEENIRENMPFTYCLEVSSEQDIEKLGKYKNEVFQKCEKYNISILEEVSNECYKNYCDGKVYTYEYIKGFGSCDDAEEVIVRFWREIEK